MADNATLVVYDITGKETFTQKITATAVGGRQITLDISDWTQKIYLLRINSKSTSKVYKLIVTK